MSLARARKTSTHVSRKNKFQIAHFKKNYVELERSRRKVMKIIKASKHKYAPVQQGGGGGGHQNIFCAGAIGKQMNI